MSYDFMKSIQIKWDYKCPYCKADMSDTKRIKRKECIDFLVDTYKCSECNKEISITHYHHEETNPYIIDFEKAEALEILEERR